MAGMSGKKESRTVSLQNVSHPERGGIGALAANAFAAKDLLPVMAILMLFVFMFVRSVAFYSGVQCRPGCDVVADFLSLVAGMRGWPCVSVSGATDTLQLFWTDAP